MKFALILLFTAALFLVVWGHLPAQDPESYFDFADKREMLNVPNFLDVASNIIFFFVGILMVLKTVREKAGSSNLKFRMKMILATGVFLTAIGSAYFHLTPTPETLVWDRLPMTIAFSAVIALAVHMRVDLKLGYRLMLPLIVFGIWTIWGYKSGWITLRPYIALQFGGLVIAALIFGLLKGESNSKVRRAFLLAVVFYVLAKVFELRDHQVFELTSGWISGHTLKHLAAGVASYQLIKI